MISNLGEPKLLMSNSKSNFLEQYSHSIQCNDLGIYFADSSEKVSYPEDGNNNCYEIEENSFWFRHRNNCIIEMIKNFRSSTDGSIFDIGGGNGFVAKGLMDAGFEVVMVEPGIRGVRNGKKRGLPHVICATTHTANLNQEPYPLSGYLM